MEQVSKFLLALLLVVQEAAVHPYSVPADASNPKGMVVSIVNITAKEGSRTVLSCKSYRMVWTQDSLNDRQRVVHWDLYRSQQAAERLCDMYSAGDQRVYHTYNKGRISMPENAFMDGNFSLIVQDVAVSDQGIYSCNLHHHYCHLYETVQLQLEVTEEDTKSCSLFEANLEGAFLLCSMEQMRSLGSCNLDVCGQPSISRHKAAEKRPGELTGEVQRFWDGEKVVMVALKGSPVVLPCINRNQVWIGRDEEDQQVVHWDRQPPGVPHDRADRLIDLYASGEGRLYGPFFLRQKMNITEKAFALGDFSLRISSLEAADEGIYSCHLHHHYCGLHERRIFQVSVVEPEQEKKAVVNLTRPNPPAPDPNSGRNHNVINVIIPESRAHFFHQLGYVLATLLLFILLLILAVLVTRQHRRRGFQYNVKKYDEKELTLREVPFDATNLSNYKSEDFKLDYKNNILKEKAEQNKILPAKNIDLDKEFRKENYK